MRLPPSESETSGPNLTPVIDVVFLLLIFFLVATKFDQQEKLVSINLAEIFQAQPLAAGAKEVIVNVTHDGQFVVGGQTLPEDKLVGLLHTAAIKNPHGKVQVRADENVKFKYPLTVIGICKKEELSYYCTVRQRKE